MEDGQRRDEREYDGFGLLDMLAVVLEGWKLMVIVPLVAVAAVYALIVIVPMPAVYSASALVAMMEKTALLHLAPESLDSLVAPTEASDDSLRVTVEPGDQENTYSITVASSDRAAALAALGRIVTALVASDFQDEARLQLEREIETRTRRLENQQQTIADLSSVLNDITSSPSPEADTRMISVAETIDALSENAMRGELSLIADQRELTGWTQPKVIGDFEVSSRGPLPSNRILVTFAWVVSLFAVVVILFLRDFWKRAQDDPTLSLKIERIRRALH